MFKKWIKRPSRFHTQESKGINKKRRENGSITLEATIFLTMFIMFYMFFIYLVQMTKAQVVLQYSINQVAKEVSAYSYILTKTGSIDKIVQTAESAGETKEDTKEVIDSASTSFENLCNLFSGESVNLIDDTINTIDSVEDTYNKAVAYKDKYFSDLNVLLEKLLELLKAEAANIVSDAIIGEIVESEVKKQIEVMSHKDADEYLRDLGIVDGLDGLKFNETKWAQESKEGMPVLEVTVVYEMKMNLGWFELEPRKFKLTAKTALW